MKKRMLLNLGLIIICFIVLFGGVIVNKFNNNISMIKGTVYEIDKESITIVDDDNVLYTFAKDDIDTLVGDVVELSFKGKLDKDESIQSNKIIDFKVIETSQENNIPKDWLDDGIFSDYYLLAYNKLKDMSLEEKISQVLLVRYPDDNQVSILKKYQFGGYVFFAKDFKDKTKKEVQDMINELQSVSNIKILTATDEEGGSVVRVSSNSNLRSERFKSSSELYNINGLIAIKEDTIEKSKLLNELGINLNLAPVVDVSTDPDDYMYSRSLKEDTDTTSKYAKTVIEASKGLGVSYTLKHFPGYGNNSDTHYVESVDNRTYDDIVKNDLPPFISGIESGAEAILVSHNIVTSIDKDNPASLSLKIHSILRNDLNFSGIIITDDLAMGSVSNISNASVLALKSGNDLIITTDYINTINEITLALEKNDISEDTIDRAVFRVLAWKYYKGLMYENQK